MTSRRAVSGQPRPLRGGHGAAAAARLLPAPQRECPPGHLPPPSRRPPALPEPRGPCRGLPGAAGPLLPAPQGEARCSGHAEPRPPQPRCGRCAAGREELRLKLCRGRFSLGTSSRFFTERLIRPRDGQPREAVPSPSLGEFRAGRGAQGHGLGGAVVIAHRLDSMISKGFSSLTDSVSWQLLWGSLSCCCSSSRTRQGYINLYINHKGQ